jgi:diguanylate cyclase (GGDEF)-like protein
LQGTYNHFLVVLSILVATLTGYCTLEFSARTRTALRPRKRAWLAAGAIAAGTGIWSMHFIGMLAFRLPIPLGYSRSLTLLSWALPVVSAGGALALVQRSTIERWQWALAATLMGAAIAGMHYLGMMAMQMSPPIHYNMPLVIISIAIAIGLSGVALWSMRHAIEFDRDAGLMRKTTVAVILGGAISLMHYTGMWAAHFPDNAICGAANELNEGWLPLVVGTSSVLLLLGTTLVVYLDRRRAEHLRMSETDALTGLKNRHFLHTRLPGLVSHAQESGTSFHLAFVDLDGFKLVNDTMGHEIGDKVLVIAARRICDCLRDKDVVARVGGDEFVVMIFGADEAQLECIMQRIVLSIQKPMHVDAETIRISASAGVARHFTGQEPEPLLVRADMAMYHAKREGKNTWKRFTESMDEERLHAAEMHRGLQRAFERSEFRLFYQPKYAAGTREIVGVEALVRWIDPDKGIRLPGDFITVAERTGLIVALGDWVLNEACRQIREWKRRGWVIPVSVNVSALQMRGQEITSKVLDTLDKHQIGAESLTLEITESVAIADPDQAMQVFNTLRHCGVSISIDDFGTGYSSLAYLRNFPAAEIKIDRAFVRDIAKDRQALELVRAIVTMGHALGMLVVAEGVEDEKTTALLEDLNCDVLQGYHLGMPMKAEELNELLAQAR